jgi:hypothetical protein
MNCFDVQISALVRKNYLSCGSSLIMAFSYLVWCSAVLTNPMIKKDFMSVWDIAEISAYRTNIGLSKLLEKLDIVISKNIWKYRYCYRY